MIGISKTIALASLLPALAHGWALGIYSQQVTCGGNYAPDSERSGTAATTSKCESFGFPGINALRITDWDDGCRFDIYTEDGCDTFGNKAAYSYEKLSNYQTQGPYTCIVDKDRIPDSFAFKYVCGGGSKVKRAFEA